jgi:phosphohistidine swiveling domain-containing protein
MPPVARIDVVGIDSAQCRDHEFVGAKAASLALARAAGFPVPDSVVIPAPASAPGLAAAAGVAAREGLHAGRLAVMSADRAGLAHLADLVRPLGAALAVRSSSPWEDDPRLSGAFTSLIGVTPDEIPTAVLAVWASAITAPDEPAPQMAVLIQPELAAAFAGTAELLASGDVEVVMTDGPAAPLMAGWIPGLAATVHPVGDITPATPSAAALSTAATSVLRAAAALVREVAAALGDNLAEWVFDGDRIWLVQCRQAVRPAPPEPSIAVGFDLAAAVDHIIALRAARCAGDLAERWLLPWAIAWDGPMPGAEPLAQAPDNNPGRTWQLLRDLSDQLTAQVWDIPPNQAGPLATRLPRLLRAGQRLPADPEQLNRPDPALVGRIAQVSQRLIAHLRHRRIVTSVSQFWALPADLGPILRGASAPPDAYSGSQRAALRWEPLLYSGVMALGQQFRGTPASAGIGSGRAVLAGDAATPGTHENGGFPARSVIVAEYALPRYAPLLMGAAALVTHGGSEAAHLIGVARSLGVPAVVGCDLAPLIRENAAAYIAVDGDSGAVAALTFTEALTAAQRQ